MTARLCVALIAVCWPMSVLAQDGLGMGHGAESRNMRLVGASDLQGRSAFQPFIIMQGEGRFGPHQTQENLTPIYHKRIVFVAWFNAGVRAVDIRDPYNPREVGFYIPATN